MIGRSKRNRLYSSALFIFGFLTATNGMVSTGDSGWLALIMSGLLTGAAGGIVALETLKHYGSAENGELSGRTRRKIAFVNGIVVGAALTPAVAMLVGAGGAFLFMVALVVGFAFSDRARRMLNSWMTPPPDPRQRHSGGPHADRLEDEPAFKMPKFADDSTREQLAATAVMMLGFVLSAAAVLGIYAGFLEFMRRFPV